MAYMNSGEKTKIIADGIAIYANFMSKNPTQARYAKAKQQWLDWCTKINNKTWEGIVKREQYRLFDIVNNEL